MELDELSACTTGRLGYTWPTTAYAIGGTATLALRCFIILASWPQLPPPALVLSDDCGPPGAVGAWAPPPHPPGPQDLPRDYGPDGAAGGLSRSTLRQADDTTTPRPLGTGRHVSPTSGTRSQTTCYVRRGTGRLVYYPIIAFLFLGESHCIAIETRAVQTRNRSTSSSSQVDVILDRQ